jgi:myosin heavy chain, clone 203 (fragment)
MRTSGFEVPELEYCLEIDGKRVEMKQRLEDVGCVENSEVRVVTVTGESLDKHFSVKDKEEEDLPKDSSSKTMNENPVKAITKPVAGSESVETTPNADQNPQEPDPVEAASVPDDSLVTVTRRANSKYPKEDPRENSVPRKVENTTELPEELKLLLKQMMSDLSEDSIEYKQMNAIKGIIEDYSHRLEEVLNEYTVMKDKMDEIHYENQMLREMYNIAVPDVKTSSETERSEKNSWRRVANDRATGEDILLDLPEDPESLKKLVNEKYATALMNERRYIKEKKRCQKYRLIAEAAGVDGDSVNDVYLRLHEVMEHRDELKETNLNLKEEERALRQEIDARDDEIQRLKITIQSRDEEIQHLVEQIQLFDEQLKEAKEGELPKESKSEEMEVILDDRVKELEEQVTLLQQKDEVQPQESEEVQQWREKGKELEEECKRLREEKEQLERALNYEEEDKTLKEMSDLLQMLMKHTASRKECVKALYATRNDNTE